MIASGFHNESCVKGEAEGPERAGESALQGRPRGRESAAGRGVGIPARNPPDGIPTASALVMRTAAPVTVWGV